MLRPIPPLAWVPASIIFWPTQELSIAFVTFLGGFFTIVINVIGGAEAIDPRIFQSARSMGASRGTVSPPHPARRPAVDCGRQATAIGVTWEVVVAAEMISGGASGACASSGGGLGFFIWNSYVGGAYTNIVVGMISIGFAGYLSSAVVRWAMVRDAMAQRKCQWRMTQRCPLPIRQRGARSSCAKSANPMAPGVFQGGCPRLRSRRKPMLTVMIGPSGAGKSTLIRLLAGFEPPSSGQHPDRRKARHRAGTRPPGRVSGERPVPLDERRGQCAVRPPRAGRDGSVERRACRFPAGKVGLPPFRRHFPSQLSGGMQRRAELTRALINNPGVMILDEPFRGLDAMTKKLMLEYYAKL